MLETILASARQRLPESRAERHRFEADAAGMAPARSLAAALAGPGLDIIAEIKRRSPSVGEISPHLEPAAQAAAYVSGGAAAISVLTEPEFFAGSLEDLRAARSTVSVPILRKDFLLDPAQVWEARAAGADAVLLIVAVLDDADLGLLLAETAAAGMEALVEVHTSDEAKRAIAAGAVVVGVNNRDLETFHTDLGVAETVAPLLQGAACTVAESGVSGREGAARMAAAGYDAILVGEALVRADDPAALVAELGMARRAP